MAKKKIMLKAETHYGSIELPMTQARALSFSKKLLSTHQRELSKYNGETWVKTYWGKRKTYKLTTMAKPFIKLEFIEIEA